MSSINYESLALAIEDNIDSSLQGKYDFDELAMNSQLCWDNTAIQVKSSDFIMIFDIMEYELINYEGMDI